ncbi:hypothetical protein J6590_064357 [Homalodisca vitripennis]|nr:hypothetical protein J6590_064357 [Homalodisca vitripennis]
MIEQRSSANVCSFIRPGAKFGQVTELNKELSNDDHLLVIAGTNNIGSTSIEQLLKDVQTLIKNSKHTNLVLATVPMRFDTPNLDLKKYYGKPTNNDYNDAFYQFDLDFKSKGLKTLICSAMGCFQRSTGATVYVISYDQTARRELWNGLTHSEFVENLRKLFSTTRPVDEAQQMDQPKDTDVISTTPSATSTVHRPPANVTASESSHQSAGVVLSETSNTSFCCMSDEHTLGVENDPEHCVSFVNNSNVNSTVSLASSIGFLGM